MNISIYIILILSSGVNAQIDLTNIFNDLLQNGTFSSVNFCEYVRYLVLSDDCVDQLLMVCNGLLKQEKWALEMIDAIAKPQTGILYGNIMHVGNYDECLRVSKRISNKKQKFLRGKYCSVQYRIANFDYSMLGPDNFNLIIGEQESMRTELIQDMKMSYGICVPQACSAQFFQKISNYFFNSKVSLYFNDRYCYSETDEIQWSIRKIFGVLIFGFSTILTLISTLYDVLVYRNQRKGSKFLVAFSFYTNGRKLFSTKSSDADSLNCLNGLRVISMIWIILCHRYMLNFILPLVNLLYAFDWMENAGNVMMIVGGNMAVDTFFTISGLLLMYTYIKSESKGRHTTIPKLYFHRLLRLTPSLAMIVLLTLTILEDIGSGPFWIAYDYFVAPCENYWWSTLLYISNYINAPTTCVGQSWYLAVDTQLYILSPLLLLPVIRWPKIAVPGIAVISLILAGVSFEETWRKSYGVSFFVFNPIIMENLYSATYSRASPWLIGMITGYVVFRIRHKRLRISNMYILSIIWILSVGTMLIIMLYHCRFIVTVPTPKLETALFNALARLIWGLALSVIILLCITGNGGIINRFLSCTIFNVLTRINYSAYLLHMFVILFFMSQKRSPDTLSNISNFHGIWGDLIYTMIVSIIWTLMFESPIIALEKIAFNSQHSRKEPNIVIITEVMQNNLTVRNLSENKNESQS